jgi:selenocysteine lyase/cysteine desulfurase
VRLPIRSIADAVAEINGGRDAAERALIVVDGVHGFGAVDEAVAGLGCDFFSAGTHKWMFAPRGTGIIWAKPENWALVQPTIPSFTSLEPYTAWQEQHPPEGPTKAAWQPRRLLAQSISGRRWRRSASTRRSAASGSPTGSPHRTRIGARAWRHEARHPAHAMTRHCQPASTVSRCRAPLKEVVERCRPADHRQHLAYKVTYPRLSAGIMNTPEEVDSALKAVRALA